MITYQQAGALLGLAAARDQRTVGEADVHAWHDDLNAAGITYDDARAALTHFYVAQGALPVDDRFRATTPDVIHHARALRQDRLRNFVYNYNGDPDETPQLYLGRLRTQIAATADGQMMPPPLLVALEGGPAPEVTAELIGAVREMPEEEAQPAPPRRCGPLAVQCPQCHARVGRHCTWSGGARRPAHAARKRAVSGVPLPGEDETATRRAASAAALARLTPEERTALDHWRQDLADGAQ
ncbi:hypothetical protein [Streptomyces noursei]|uniref:hypothetical protein n=1 Tax=Streptomyces noursei TaxID=1971 RepID=UPI0023B79D71|nr:hypothetical protein [Streptomyces noursei]